MGKRGEIFFAVDVARTGHGGGIGFEPKQDAILFDHHFVCPLECSVEHPAGREFEDAATVVRHRVEVRLDRRVNVASE